MDAISQTVFSNAFVNEKIAFWFKFHLSLFPKGQTDNNPALV